MFFFFFFQAEDGIRDYKVTGVQTCALPIFADEHATVRELDDGPYAVEAGRLRGPADLGAAAEIEQVGLVTERERERPCRHARPRAERNELRRVSCVRQDVLAGAVLLELEIWIYDVRLNKWQLFGLARHGRLELRLHDKNSRRRARGVRAGPPS